MHTRAPSTAASLIAESWTLAPEAARDGRATGISAALWHHHHALSEVEAPPDPLSHRVGVMLDRADGQIWYDRRLQVSKPVPPAFSFIVPSGVSTRGVLVQAWRFLHVYVPDSYLRAASEDAGQAAGADLRAAVRYDPTLAALARPLCRELADPDAYSELMIDSIGAQIAVHLVRTCSAAGALRQERAQLAGWRLKRALEYLGAHAGDRVRVADVAAAAGLSPFHFSRAFAASVGMPPSQYLRQLRLRRAQEALASTGGSIEALAVEFGYRNAAAFARAFRRETGVSPRAFRVRGS